MPEGIGAKPGDGVYHDGNVFPRLVYPDLP